MSVEAIFYYYDLQNVCVCITTLSMRCTGSFKAIYSKSIVIDFCYFVHFITEHDESWMSSLKLLLVPCLTSQLTLDLSPTEWAAILCGVRGAEDSEELDVTMKLTAVSSVYCI